jgi:hypothetical protein
MVFGTGTSAFAVRFPGSKTLNTDQVNAIYYRIATETIVQSVEVKLA